MGASIWGGRGFGIQWLIRSLERLGLVPDMVFAWELEKMETSQVLRGHAALAAEPSPCFTTVSVE